MSGSERKSGLRSMAKDNKKSQSKANSNVSGDDHHINNLDGPKSHDCKLQPTPEQIRIADLMNDKIDDNDLQRKVETIIELTGSSRDNAVVALHDCNNDTAKAVDMILEGDSIVESEWKSSKSDRKKKKTPKTASNVESDDSKVNGNKETKIDDSSDLSKSGKSDNRRIKGTFTTGKPSRGGAPPPPRFSGDRQRSNQMNQSNNKSTFNVRKTNRDDTKTNSEFVDDTFDRSTVDTFGGSAQPPRRMDRGRGGRGRGIGRGGFGNRGGSGGRSTRTFQNRGLQNDGFPNSIDTWTNSTVEHTGKAINTDVNTMTVGNWSDIVTAEDWSEEDWDSNHMETKVFTPSTKAMEKDERNVSKNPSSSTQSQSGLAFTTLFAKPGPVDVTGQQQSMSSMLGTNLSRNATVSTAAGTALLQQLQQQSSQSQTIPQYSMSTYNKQATESIKSLVGISSSTYNSSNANLLTNTQEVDNSDAISSSQSRAQQMHQSASLANKQKMRTVRTSSKIPESAVEMPSNDAISGLNVQFGALEFGSDNSPFLLGSEGTAVFQDAVSHVTSQGKKAQSAQSTQHNTLIGPSQDNTYRPSNNPGMSDMSNKSVSSSSSVQSSVLGQNLSAEGLLERTNKGQVSYRQQKVLENSKNSDFASISAQQTMNSADITSYKHYPHSTVDTGYNSTANYPIVATTSYYSNSQSSYAPYSSNFSANHSLSAAKLRDIDNSQQKHYDISTGSMSNVATVGNLGLVSNSTVTTNVLKNSLSATGKGVHNVTAPVLGPQYIMSNPGLSIYPFAYDVQFPNPRDHNFAPYNSQDIKYNRGSESDVTSVSTSQPGVAPSQTHNQAYVNTFPPGYGFYFAPQAMMPGVNMPQSIYGTGPIYQSVTPATNAGSANSAFPKGNTGYGSHSYASGYDSGLTVQANDYVKANYGQVATQHAKPIAGTNATDLSGGNASMYSKSHTQLTKNYDKQTFHQTNTPPPFNLNSGTQSASAYGTPYILPQSQPSMSLHHLQTDATQMNAGVAGRTVSQPHKPNPTGAPGKNPYYWS